MSLNYSKIIIYIKIKVYKHRVNTDLKIKYDKIQKILTKTTKMK